MQARTVTVGGVALHVEDRGAGGVPLVLVHGYTGSSADWAVVAPELAEDRRVVAYDHRGHGFSAHGPAEGYRFDRLVLDLLGLADALGLDRFHLLGHSLGGIVAQRFALEHGERLASLVLMDTGPEPAGAIPMEMIMGMVTAGREHGMPAVYESIRPMLEGFTVGRTGEGAAAEAQRAERAARFCGHDPEALLHYAEELNAYPSMVDRLPSLSVPTTVIVGVNDTGLVPGSELMARLVPGAVLEVVADAGHSPQDDQPAAWLAVVRAHLHRAEEQP